MVQQIIKRIAVVILCFSCSVSLSSELSDLIERLNSLEAKDKVQTTVRIENVISRAKSKKTNKAENEFEVSANSDTLSIAYNGNISKITSDPNVGASEYSGDISDARNFQDFSLFRAGELMHYGPSLARELDGLKLEKKKADKYEGLACTLWTLNSKETQKTSGVKATTERDVKLWIDEEGFPVGSEFRTKVSAKMLLVFKINTETLQKQSYKKRGGRLVLTLDKNETDLQMEEEDVTQRVTTTVEIRNGLM